MTAPRLESTPAGARAPARETAARVLCRALRSLGVEVAFGLTGGAVAPLMDALAASGMKVVHCRHEGGAGFAAVEASIASGAPVAVFVTTGPGLTNVLSGISAARWEGAKIVLLSGATSPALRGRWACQETSGLTLPLSGLYDQGAFFHQATLVERASQLPQVLARLAAGIRRRQGFVAHLGLTLDLQTEEVRQMPEVDLDARGEVLDVARARETAQRLAKRPSVIWAGFGARHAADDLRALAERLGAPVMCTPRAKGLFPESHPLYLGTTGLAGQEQVERFLRAHRPDYTLVLGTRLSEPSCFWSDALIPAEAFIHVDLDPDVPGNAFPSAPTVAVQSDTGAFIRAVLAQLPPLVSPNPPTPGPTFPPHVTPEPGRRVRPQAVMAAIQRVVVEGSDATVMTESGNAFAWGNSCLRFDQPGRYRVSTGYGAMGHMAAGVVGTALVTRRKAVAVVGDGAMLMFGELSTAVQYRAPAVWVVLNDARYNMVDQGMRALGLRPVETQIPATDFVAYARALGGDGLRVTDEPSLDAALQAAMAATQPFVVDVVIDPDVPAPWMKRIENLILQGAGAKKGAAE
ncbi:MAG: thiamine pyrophosphate-binding protein [Myxococcaceae bacterium]|nr:thiamine pyrophosphate-binding protein [Myxococcaceae bacterium]